MPAAEIAEKENALETYSAQACELKRLYDRIGQIRTETAEVVKARDAALARKSELLTQWTRSEDEAAVTGRRRRRSTNSIPLGHRLNLFHPWRSSLGHFLLDRH